MSAARWWTSCWRLGTRSAAWTCCCTARRTWPRTSSRSGVELDRGDVRDADARRRALDGADAVVHLAAIVGDPGLRARSGALQRGQRGGQPRRWWPTPEPRRGAPRVRLHLLQLRPHGRSHRADRRDRRAAPGVALRRAEGGRSRSALLESTRTACPPPACASPPSTASGQRMRFDLTVNEFTRDLWADRKLEVFGEASGARTSTCATRRARWRGARGSPREQVAGEVFNAGHSDENYRKLDLVEIITGQLGRGDVSYVTATRTRATTRSPSRRSGPSSASSRCSAFPTASRRSSGRSRSSASATRSTPATGTRLMADARLIPLFDVQLERAPHRRPWRPRCARAGSPWARAPQDFERGLRRAPRRASTRSRCPAAPRRCTSPTWRPASAPGDEVIVPADHLRGDRRGRATAGPTPVFADVMGPHDLGSTPRTSRAASPPAPRRSARSITVATRPIWTRCASSARSTGMALIEDAAHSPSATPLGDAASSAPTAWRAASASSPTRSSPAARAACWPPTTTGWPTGAQPALARDDLRHLGPPPRPLARLRRGRARLQLPHGRAARGPADGAAGRARGRHRARRRLVHRYRAMLADVEGVTVPYEDDEVDVSSCYVMPVMVDDDELRDPLRQLMLERAPRADQRALPGDPRVHRLRGIARASSRTASSSAARS